MQSLHAFDCQTGIWTRWLHEGEIVNQCFLTTLLALVPFKPSNPDFIIRFEFHCSSGNTVKLQKERNG